MPKACHKIFLAFLLVIMLPLGAVAQTLDQAARQAASQNNAKVLSARTVQEGNKQVHVIKLLTRDGVVKTVRITGREQNRERQTNRDKRQKRDRLR